MADKFLEVFNMSVTAGWLVLAIIVLRFLLKKAPKGVICFLWLLVALRLIIPSTFESVMSFIPSAEVVTEESLYSDTSMVNTGIPIVDNSVNPVISKTLEPESGNSVNLMQVVIYVASYVWVVGMICMGLYAAVSYIRLRIKVREGVEDGKRIWLCDRIATPFILGVVRPKIYIPSSVEEKDKEFVIAHEKAHLKRKDHWWKPLGFALLTVYWFNPLMWVAYILLCKDIEYACDENVLKRLGTDCKKDYTNALINCSVSRRTVVVCALAFVEVGVKDRIKFVLSYKKPAVFMVVLASIVCVIFTVGFMTDPKEIRYYGRNFTEKELYTNLELCLSEYSISKIPELEINKDGMEEQDNSKHEVEKEGYELAFITAVEDEDGIKIIADFVDWISDNSQPNGFQIINSSEDNYTYYTDENTEYLIYYYFDGATYEKDGSHYSINEDNFIRYLNESYCLFWIKAENDLISEVVEQYVP